jgi:hypothetical protein
MPTAAAGARYESAGPAPRLQSAFMRGGPSLIWLGYGFRVASIASVRSCTAGDRGRKKWPPVCSAGLLGSTFLCCTTAMVRPLCGNRILNRNGAGDPRNKLHRCGVSQPHRGSPGHRATATGWLLRQQGRPEGCLVADSPWLVEMRAAGCVPVAPASSYEGGGGMRPAKSAKPLSQTSTRRMAAPKTAGVAGDGRHAGEDGRWTKSLERIRRKTASEDREAPLVYDRGCQL